MPFHESHRSRFLSRPAQADAQAILGNAAGYAVQLEPAVVPSAQSCWRVIGVHHLSPEENQGKHAVYVDVVDETGQRLRDPNLRLAWGWEGQRSDESAAPKAFDKGEDEPASHIDMWQGQQTWVQIQGDGLLSDRVLNLHTGHGDDPTPDDQKWNTLGHHSFYVLFQRTRKETLSEQPASHVLKPEPDNPQRMRPPAEQPVLASPTTPSSLSGNRLGFYLHVSQDQLGLWDAIQRVQPPVILIHADTANRMLLEEIRRFRAPDAFVIGRMFKDVHTQRGLLESSDPAAEGRAMAQQILDHDFGLATQRGENGRLLIDAWMSLNEAVPGPASQQFAEQPAEVERLLRAYDRFQVAFQQRLQEGGVEAVAFNFAAGNFTQPEHYLAYFKETLASHTYLGFHEYGWPALPPGPGVATSAGLYRRCIAGIRAQFGDRHHVLITEAGLTRAYQDPTLGDIGWLNDHTPLSEEEYWRSLAWYNDHLLQDSYVQGACLYEVGHHGDWVSFRHLGQDNQGRDLHLIDRIVALKEAAQPRSLAATTPAPAIVRKPLTIHGLVSLTGEPVRNATVRLIGGTETVGTLRNASLHAPSYVTWSRQVSGFGGTLWNCWTRLVAQQVAGLSWPEFRDEMMKYNPRLAQDDNRLQAEHTYRLPENKGGSPAIVWDRPLTGFSGSMWACWERLIANRVVGLSFANFKRGMIEHNPPLVTSKGRLQAEQRYNLPRNANHKEYALVTTTNRRGQFSFADVPAGDYRLEVRATGAEHLVTGFSCIDDLTLSIDLQPFAPPGLVTSRGVAAAGASPSDFVGMYSSEFVVGGKAFRFIGVNIRGLVHYGDGRVLSATIDGHREEQLQAAYDMGARVVRVFLPSIHSLADETITRLRGVIELLRNRFPGMYLLPAFANLYGDVPFRIPGDERFYARIDPNFNGDLLNAEFFTRGYQENFLPFVRQVIPAFRNEPRIFAWEVGNELKLDPASGPHAGDPHIAAFVRFMHLAAREIRTLAPNHLITTGMISTRHASLADEGLKRQLYATPLFDFLTVHCYNEEYENDDSGLASLLNKPFIVEEAGFGRRFGEDRGELTRRDLDFWFARGARGYMQWGFMGTPFDIGDGDDDSGMDRSLHRDWDSLFQVYRQRADELARFDPGWRIEPQRPSQPDQPPSAAGFAVGQQVFAQDWVNVRKSPGHIGKLGDDLYGQVSPGAAITITSAPAVKDGLTWYLVKGSLANGQPVHGWAAQATAKAVLLALNPPAPAAATSRSLPKPRSAARSRGLGTDEFSIDQQIFTAYYVNLRRDPGYVGKPGDHVIGQIPYGAAVTVIGGPSEADGLIWWALRAPLLDNTVAVGWAAATDPAGNNLFDRKTPPITPPVTPPAPGATGVQFKSGDRVQIVAAQVNVRRSAGYLNQPAEHVVATVLEGARFTVTGGSQQVDGLDWWQVKGVNPAGGELNGWVAVAGPDGRRLLALEATAQAIRIGRPFAARWPLTQGWGLRPEFYGQITYDGVPLKGHNGLDFGTPVNTPLLAVDAGEVIKVDFEPGGFGHHILIRHAWGESLYAHLERVDVAGNTKVAAGQQIGLSGNTGGSSGPHLHFGIRVFPYRRTDGWGGFCDPSPYMEPADVGAARGLRSTPRPMAPELPGRVRP